jgi:hypothetical protein
MAGERQALRDWHRLFGLLLTDFFSHKKSPLEGLSLFTSYRDSAWFATDSVLGYVIPCQKQSSMIAEFFIPTNSRCGYARIGRKT